MAPKKDSLPPPPRAPPPRHHLHLLVRGRFCVIFDAATREQSLGVLQYAVCLPQVARKERREKRETCAASLRRPWHFY